MARLEPRRCPSGEDLTAFAHGEHDGERRAALSRHLLHCTDCRRTYGASRTMLRRLGELGPDWEDLAALGAPRRAPTTVLSWRTLLAGAGMAVAFLAAFLSSWTPAGGPGEGARRASEAQASEISALLATQRPDGSWPADAAFGGPRSDEAATAVALLALLPDDPGVLREGPRARAVAHGTRWLLSRHRTLPDVDGTAEQLRNDAVALAALVELEALTGDAALRHALEPSVRVLRRSVEALPADPWVLRWVRLALLRARDAGWPRLDGAVRRLEARLGAVGAVPPWGPGAVVGAPGPAVETPCAVAVRVLARRGSS